MGENLYKIGRISRVQYLKIETEIRKYLDEKLNSAYKITMYYTSKPDFGDLDIIINIDILKSDWSFQLTVNS